ncbi:hypothetical protein [Marinobacter zhejiangensis]|uniref:Uncharacterized protein n=1 Tax=Marinobacter zhejiangensis TaxID=488535 RepID=A0A1I4T987_9GAMM|nr:hypothetical protein [Marinobacter zhejiangensis]SFM73368.1 hypothetical protein SAMN04487963_3512 [Marinobacter zhejiangensis]
MAMLNEAGRQFYLAQAGIRLWYARAPLPGAAPSPDFDFSEPEPEAVSPQASVEPAASLRSGNVDRANRLARIQGLMSGEPQPSSGQGVAAEPEAKPGPIQKVPSSKAELPDEITNEAVALAVESEVADARQVLHAHWGFWIGDRVMLVSALNDEASFQLQESLAKNILRALNQPDVKGFRIQWPVFNNTLVPGNDRSGFCRVVADECRGYAGRETVLLGLAPELSGDDRDSLLKVIPGKPFVDFGSSLAALSTDPAGKRELWAQLRDFRGRVR